MIEVLIGLAVAVSISLTTYAGKRQKGQAFDPYKLLRTVLIGLVGGIGAAITGAEITAENWEAYIAANGFAVTIADQIVKMVMRLFEGKKDGPTMGVPTIILCLFLPLSTIGCSTTGSHTGGVQQEQTVLDQAKTFIKQGKKAEKIYVAVTKAYSVAYRAFKDNPSADNRKAVEKMQKLHRKVFGLYEDFRQYHTTLIYLVETYDGAAEDDQTMGTTNRQIEDVLLDLLFLAATIKGGD